MTMTMAALMFMRVIARIIVSMKGMGKLQTEIEGKRQQRIAACQSQRSEGHAEQVALKRQVRRKRAEPDCGARAIWLQAAGVWAL